MKKRTDSDDENVHTDKIGRKKRAFSWTPLTRGRHVSNGDVFDNRTTFQKRSGWGNELA